MKLCLIDLSSIFWSSWHATAGQEPDAAYRVALERVARYRDGFDATIVCCDVGPSWRKKEFPAYKSGRPERDAAAYDQLRRVREQIETDGVRTLSVEEFEADDLIATICKIAPPEWDQIEIVSGDKDLMQLVAPGVTVRSTTSDKVYNEEGVREKFGVPPARLGDWLALVGDKSDALPGCPGVGDKNATRLLLECGSLDNMFAVPESITPEGIRTKFVAAADQIRLTRKLISLSTDVPIDFAEAIRPPPAKEKSTTAPVPDEGDESVPDQKDVAPAPGDTANPGSSDPEPVKGGARVEDAPGATTSLVRAAPEAPLVLDKADPRWTLALEPRNAKSLWWYCEELHKSQLYRKFPNADAIMACVLRGRALGLDMTTSLDVFNVVKGKPTMGAMAIVGLCLASGKAEYFDPIESDSDTQATWETKRVGRPPKRLTYTIDMAQKAGLLAPTQNGEPSNWVKRPRPMLRKQAAVELARLCYPDIVSNIYAPDELED